MSVHRGGGVGPGGTPGEMFKSGEGERDIPGEMSKGDISTRISCAYHMMHMMALPLPCGQN